MFMVLEQKLNDFREFGYQIKVAKRAQYKIYLQEDLTSRGLEDKTQFFLAAFRKIGLPMVKRVYDNKSCSHEIRTSIREICKCEKDQELSSLVQSSQIILLAEQLAYRLMLQPGNSWNGLSAEEILEKTIRDAKRNLKYTYPKTENELAFFGLVQETLASISFFRENIPLAAEIFLDAFDRLVSEYIPTLQDLVREDVPLALDSTNSILN